MYSVTDVHVYIYIVVACVSVRLVKGDGEIVEEIVSRERHKAINKVCVL